MSVAIFWAPLPVAKQCLASGEVIKEILEETFGEIPCVLDRTHLPVLRGMYSAIRKEDKMIIRTLIMALEQYEAVQLDKEY